MTMKLKFLFFITILLIALSIPVQAYGTSFSDAEEVTEGQTYTVNIQPSSMHYWKVYLNSGDTLHIYFDQGNGTGDDSVALNFFNPSQQSITTDLLF